jgi:bifunctional non-homologous end joining protein LigD
MQQITLYYQLGASDKIYQAGIAPKDSGYVVHFAFGRRGATLQTGVKNQIPVPYEEASRVYDRLVSEKLAKGYTPGESGTPYQQTHKAEQVTGVHPQLLNPITPEQAAALVTDAAWAMQEKYDGRRMLIRKTIEGIEGINRNGLIVALPEPVANVAGGIAGTFVLDGESIGNTVVGFDLLERNGVDQRGLPYRQRLFTLLEFVPGPGPHLRSAETALDTAHKAEMLSRLRTDNREGVVFKRLAGTYTVSRPSTGGDALKCKFYESASFIVSGANARRSVSLSLFEAGNAVPAGNVTIPPNHTIPRTGAVVEVRYLYALRESGCIYQPVYLGPRDDVEPGECQTRQLKWKPSPKKV